MKTLSKKEKHIRLQRRRQKKSLKRKRKIQKRQKNLRRFLQGKPKKEHQNIKKRLKLNDVKAPKIFSLLDNTEKSLDFLNKIENNFKNSRGVFVVLKNVELIDHSAITVLLSLMYKFKLAHIEFNGDFPKNEEVKRKIVDSQFFERLMQPLSSRKDYILKKENQIFARANQTVVSEMGLKIIEEASQTIWGEKRACKGVQMTLLELMQNTNNHASLKEGEVYWWLSVNHNKDTNTVDFYFVDYGQGILGSLGLRNNPDIWTPFLDFFKKMVESDSEYKVIKSLLDGEHRNPVQRNHPYYRGKGIPSIKGALDKNQISNLHIITNNTFTDVANNDFRRLSKDFSGTFFHWQLCKDNINEIWNLS